MGNKRTYLVKSSLFICVCFLFFLWGVLTIRNEIFPYSQLNSIYSESKEKRKSYKELKKSEKEQKEKQLHKLWAQKVISGGYILHFRHAQREKWNDVTAFDAYELKENILAEDATFAKATCLTPQGIEEAKLIGNIFNIAGVKVSEVVSSPSCRARQTATYAFGRFDRISNSLLHRTAMVPEQHPLFAEQLRKLINDIEPGQGENVVLSGHGGTLRFDAGVVIDIDHTGGIDERDETGFVVIQKMNGKVIAHHKFRSIKDFATAIIELPVN